MPRPWEEFIPIRRLCQSGRFTARAARATRVRPASDIRSASLSARGDRGSVGSDLFEHRSRDHLILEYEIPKYDGDLGNPNFLVPLSLAICRRKTRYLDQAFRSQKGRHWFSEDTFLALMRLRGVECASRYAEAFYCRKMICD